LLGEVGFDLGRATKEMMVRLRGIVDAVNASRDADQGRAAKARTAN
jgi:hypothetical protein